MDQAELQPAYQSKRRRPSASLRIDMTPMVDLGFLLITFFIFTTTMTDPHLVSLAMPHDGDSMEVKQSGALTLILAGNDQVYAYEGQWEKAKEKNRIIASGYDVKQGVGQLIRAKQDLLKASSKEGKDALVLMIKPTSASSYKNLVDVLDETLINNVKRYAILKPGIEENEFANRGL